MAKRKLPKMTAEEWEQREEHYRMAQERIAYHQAKAREEEEARARNRPGRFRRAFRELLTP
jgi:hypothetical protein